MMRCHGPVAAALFGLECRCPPTLRARRSPRPVRGLRPQSAAVRGRGPGLRRPGPCPPPLAPPLPPATAGSRSCVEGVPVPRVEPRSRQPSVVFGRPSRANRGRIEGRSRRARSRVKSSFADRTPTSSYGAMTPQAVDARARRRAGPTTPANSKRLAAAPRRRWREIRGGASPRRAEPVLSLRRLSRPAWGERLERAEKTASTTAQRWACPPMSNMGPRAGMMKAAIGVASGRDALVPGGPARPGMRTIHVGRSGALRGR